MKTHIQIPEYVMYTKSEIKNQIYSILLKKNYEMHVNERQS